MSVTLLDIAGIGTAAILFGLACSHNARTERSSSSAEFGATRMPACGTKLPKLVGQSTSALPGNSDINLFCYGQGVIDLDAEVSDGALDLGVAEQKLHGPQIASAPVDQGGFGSSE